ncbi:hypothetical protein CORC01_14186 [Colletotrichum orchidophilum]|uniref:Uncharacterized protein n=1 Tax=Colletotrichum orchidophilum TaxID=1209926 RepID=A0A1G4AMX6_9PEZI|nr:uncharacterized protein CORC01_14186 [Colletotrichum orchidophilum]OHE90517.1 hypothetical protein CORC01_14186 [Colletotrichum orchidophilum]
MTHHTSTNTVRIPESMLLSRTAPNHQGIERHTGDWMRQRLQGQPSLCQSYFLSGAHIVSDAHVGQLDASRQRASQDQGRKETPEETQKFTAKKLLIIAPQALNRSHCWQQVEYLISLQRRPLRWPSSRLAPHTFVQIRIQPSFLDLDMKRPCRFVAFGDLDLCKLHHHIPIPACLASLARRTTQGALASPCLACHCLSWRRAGEGNQLQNVRSRLRLRSQRLLDKAPAVEGMCMLNLVRPTHTRGLRLLAKLS